LVNNPLYLLYSSGGYMTVLIVENLIQS